MKVGVEHFNPKSKFLVLEKDFSLIVHKLLEDQNLCKLLYYTQPDALKAADLTMAQRVTLINDKIRLVPNILITPECPNYVIVRMDNFVPNRFNPEFRDCQILFEILIHPDHWNLGDFQLRPYKIAGAIDAMMDGAKLTGIGELSFNKSKNLVLNNQLMGLQLVYDAIHGVEDEIPLE